MIDRSIHPNTRTLLDAWRRMQADPKSHALTGPGASDHENLIDRIFVIEQREDQAWLVRTSGTALNALVGRNLAHSNYLDLWTGPDRAMMAAFLEAIRFDGAPGVVRGRGETLNGERVDLEITLMPLSAATGRSARLRFLGLYQTLGPEYGLQGKPVFRHRISMLVPPDTRRAGIPLRLVANN
ncbi:MAG: PAS domain-containing protein [Pannonibacter sp.]